MVQIWTIDQLTEHCPDIADDVLMILARQFSNLKATHGQNIALLDDWLDHMGFQFTEADNHLVAKRNAVPGYQRLSQVTR